MRTKIYLTLVILLSATINLHANFLSAPYFDDDIEINQEVITYKNDVVGKFETEEVESGNAKTKTVNVSIFSKKGMLIAMYNLELLNKPNKNKDVILSASVKTTKDKVIHSGTNFIDFHIKGKKTDESKLIQLDKVIRYLIDYNYL